MREISGYTDLKNVRKETEHMSNSRDFLRPLNSQNIDIRYEYKKEIIYSAFYQCLILKGNCSPFRPFLPYGFQHIRVDGINKYLPINRDYKPLGYSCEHRFVNYEDYGFLAFHLNELSDNIDYERYFLFNDGNPPWANIDCRLNYLYLLAGIFKFEEVFPIPEEFLLRIYPDQKRNRIEFKHKLNDLCDK